MSWAQPSLDIVMTWVGMLPGAVPWMLIGAGLAMLVAWYRDRRWVVWCALLAAIVGGGWFAWQQMSLMDDAFISFRYIDNLLHGHGMVWNPGEWVLGITNLGWTWVLAALTYLLPVRLEYIALVACVVVWVGMVLATLGTSRALHDGERDGAWLPLAPALVAMQYTVTAFATSGLETGFVAFLAMVGLFALVARRDGWGTGLAGLAWILATIGRMDHALLYATGSVWVAARHLPGAREHARDRWALVAWAAPFTLWVAQAAWSYATYGDILPNTYYAKSADDWYVSQGLIYAGTFALGSQLWLALPLAGAWLVVGRDENRGVAWWMAGFVALYVLYTIKVGGDFMYGRFFVTVVPMILLAAERTVVHLLRTRGARALLAVAVLGATLRGGSLIEPYRVRWYLADESTVYPVTSLDPLLIDHHHFRSGNGLNEILVQRGIRFPIASSGIGMLGYYSKLEVIDLVGLTDATIGHRPARRRSRPGHEKEPEPGYLDDREVVFARWPLQAPRLLDGRRVFFPGSSDRWYIWRYDEPLMQRLAREAPEIRFRPFDRWFHRRYRPALSKLSAKEIEADLAELDRFYWDHNGPDSKREIMVRMLQAARRREAAAGGPPAPSPGR